MLRACERTLAMAAHPLRLAIVGDVVSISLYKPRFLLLAILFRSSTKKIKSKETIAINSLLLYCLLRAFASLVLLSRNTGHRYPRLSAGVLKRCRLHQESSKSKDTIEFNSLLSSLLFCFRFSCSAVSKPWPSPLTSFRRCQKRCRDTIAPSWLSSLVNMIVKFFSCCWESLWSIVAVWIWKEDMFSLWITCLHIMISVSTA
jgi:hypothetical protein